MQDYLGEELLRYIGDVGDNFQIDDDYWQARMGSRIGNPPPNWGQRGPCQTPWTGALNDPARGTAYDPLPPQISCGNYFSATDGAALEAVFNQIASRLFTRLSQ